MIQVNVPLPYDSIDPECIKYENNLCDWVIDNSADCKWNGASDIVIFNNEATAIIFKLTFNL